MPLTKAKAVRAFLGVYSSINTAIVRAGEMSIASRMGSSASHKSDLLGPGVIHIVQILYRLISK